MAGFNADLRNLIRNQNITFLDLVSVHPYARTAGRIARPPSLTVFGSQVRVAVVTGELPIAAAPSVASPARFVPGRIVLQAPRALLLHLLLAPAPGTTLLEGERWRALIMK